MKIGIIGTGGVGGFFGAKLAQAGLDVTFVARGKHLQAMNDKGLSIKSIDGDFHLSEVKATSNIKEIQAPDLIVLGVKAWQIKEIRSDLSQILQNHTMVLPLQNGVMAAQELSQVIAEEHILGGLCRIISQLDGPGVIRHMGVPPSIVVGELHKEGSERIQKLQETFENAGIKTHISEDIQAELWKKFILICTGGLAAVTRTTFGQMRALKETRQMMISLMEEIYGLSKKAGVQIDADYVEKTVAFIDTFPEDATFSLSRDIWENKPSEIDYQNGTVVSLGEKYGFPTPINQFVYHSILPQELKARNLTT